MNKLTLKIAFPIVLAGVFAIVAFVAMGYDQLEPEFYIIISFLVIFVFFFGLSIGQSLSSPVRKILDRAVELSKGDLSTRVYLESKDELAELAEVFNKIAEELENSRGQEANVDKAVSIKVKAKTKELEETINALEQKVENRTVELEKLINESSRLQADTGNKQQEIAELKKELDCFKQKIGKSGNKTTAQTAEKSAQKEVVNNNE